MTIIPHQPGFLESFASGTTQYLQQKQQFDLFNKMYQNAINAFDPGAGGGAPGGGQPNPQAVFGNPAQGSQVPMPQPPGSPMQQVGGAMRQGLQGMGQRIGAMGRGIGGALGMQPQAAPPMGGMGAPGMMRGGMGQGPQMGAQGGPGAMLGGLGKPGQMDPRRLMMLIQQMGMGAR